MEIPTWVPEGLTATRASGQPQQHGAPAAAISRSTEHEFDRPKHDSVQGVGLVSAKSPVHPLSAKKGVAVVPDIQRAQSIVEMCVSCLQTVRNAVRTTMRMFDDGVRSSTRRHRSPLLD